MWLMLNDAFFSLVSKECARDELLVRARRKGDIEKVFPGAKVKRGEFTDYAYRAPVKKTEIATALTGEINRVTYANFKDSVADDKLHGAYGRVWAVMAGVQETKPYGGTFFPADTEDFIGDDGPTPWSDTMRKPAAKKKPTKIRRRGQ